MTRVTVWDWERGVRFHRGVITGEVGPGRHRLRRGEQVRTIDMRPTSLLLTGQDVPAADGVLVRLGIVLRWSVTDATTYLKAAGDALAELHVVAQLALRRAVSTRAHDELDPQREAIATEVAEGVAARVAELGAAVHEVTVRDVVLPNELRRAAVAEIVARKEGLVTLERARAETAALRSLLNAARLAEQHPALLHLRTLQAAGQPGATVVLERPH